MASCPISGDDLDQKIIQAAKDSGSQLVGSSTSLGMVLRSGRRLGGMKGGVKKCSLVGLTLCSILMIAAVWAGYTGCRITTPILIEFINKTAPGAIDNLSKVGLDVSSFLGNQFEGICLLVRAQMKIKGQDAFKVIFDEVTKSNTNMFAFAGAVTAVTSIVSKTLQLTSDANTALQTAAMEICERGGFTIGEDDAPGGASASKEAGKAAIDRAAASTTDSNDDAAPPQPPARSGRRGGSSKRTMYRKKSTGKKSISGGRRHSAARSKKNRGKH